MTDHIYELCLLEEILPCMEQETEEEQPHSSSAQSPEYAPETPPEEAPRAEEAPAEEPSRPRETPHSEQETLELAWQVAQLHKATQREIRQLTALMEEQTRKEAASSVRNRREGRRCRSYGFIAGAALVMAAMPLLTAAMTLSWKALGWFAQVMEVSPAALCASLFCVLLGIGTLKATKPLGDLISEWLEDEEEDDGDEEV